MNPAHIRRLRVKTYIQSYLTSSLATVLLAMLLTVPSNDLPLGCPFHSFLPLPGAKQDQSTHMVRPSHTFYPTCFSLFLLLRTVGSAARHPESGRVPGIECVRAIKRNFTANEQAHQLADGRQRAAHFSPSICLFRNRIRLNACPFQRPMSSRYHI